MPIEHVYEIVTEVQVVGAYGERDIALADGTRFALGEFTKEISIKAGNMVRLDLTVSETEFEAEIFTAAGESSSPPIRLDKATQLFLKK